MNSYDENCHHINELVQLAKRNQTKDKNVCGRDLLISMMNSFTCSMKNYLIYWAAKNGFVEFGVLVVHKISRSKWKLYSNAALTFLVKSNFDNWNRKEWIDIVIYTLFNEKFK